MAVRHGGQRQRMTRGRALRGDRKLVPADGPGVLTAPTALTALTALTA